jgi:hypothetical protein
LLAACGLPEDWNISEKAREYLSRTYSRELGLLQGSGDLDLIEATILFIPGMSAL